MADVINAELGDGALIVSNDLSHPDRYWVEIDHTGTGDEGGIEHLRWVSSVTREQLRALAEELLRISK